MACEDLEKIVKDLGFEVRYKGEVGGQCVVDFIRPEDLKKVVEKEAPVGWYASSVACRDDECEITMNRIIKKDFFEFFIPEECGKTMCRLHVFPDVETKNPEDRLPRVGFEIKSIKKDRIKELLINYFFT